MGVFLLILLKSCAPNSFKLGAPPISIGVLIFDLFSFKFYIGILNILNFVLKLKLHLL